MHNTTTLKMLPQVKKSRAPDMIPLLVIILLDSLSTLLKVFTLAMRVATKCSMLSSGLIN